VAKGKGQEGGVVGLRESGGVCSRGFLYRRGSQERKGKGGGRPKAREKLFGRLTKHCKKGRRDTGKFSTGGEKRGEGSQEKILSWPAVAGKRSFRNEKGDGIGGHKKKGEGDR